MSLKVLFEKTVFLLGAGASMDAGCLSSKQMLFDLKKKINELPATDGRKTSFQAIYDFILASLNYQWTIKTPDAIFPRPTISLDT